MKSKETPCAGRQGDASISRGEFFRSVGIAGLGFAGLGAALADPAAAQEGKKGKYVVVVTYGGNNPNRAVWALLMADTILKKGWGAVHVWMTMEGADLCRSGSAERIVSPIFEKFGNALEIMERVRKAGGKFGVCPPCSDYFAGDKRLEWIEPLGGDWLMKNIQDSWVVWM